MNDDAVGPVVAVVLLLGLFTVASAVWSITTLPDIVTERETAHLADVGDGLLRLRDDVEGAAIRASTSPIAGAIRLAPDAIPIVQPAAASGRIAAVGGHGFAASFPDATLLGGGGQLAGPATGPLPASYDDVASLEAFLASLEADGTSGSKIAWIELRATDGTGAVWINLTHRDAPSQSGCSGRELRVVVMVVGAGTLYDQGVVCGLGNDLQPYQVDMLDPQYGFTSALATLSAPFDVSATSGGESLVDAWHAIWWKDAAGGDHTSGGSSSATGVVSAHDGVGVLYDMAGQGLVDQDLVLDGGALVAVQPDGAAIVAAPGIRMTTPGGQPALSWTYLHLTGGGESQGRGTASLTAHPATATDVLFTADAGSITLDTPYADAWRAFLDDEATLAGLGSALALGGDTDTVTLSIASGTWTIHLRVVTAALEVR